MVRKPRPLPDLETLRRLYHYDPETGELFSIRAGRVVKGSLNGRYMRVTLPERQVAFVHRVAWKLHYGAEPGPILDHINRDRQDNRIANLREVSALESTCNRTPTAPFRGVFVDTSQSGQHVARITVLGRDTFLGRFHSEREATAAVLGAIRALDAAKIPQPVRDLSLILKAEAA